MNRPTEPKVGQIWKESQYAIWEIVRVREDEVKIKKTHIKSKEQWIQLRADENNVIDYPTASLINYQDTWIYMGGGDG